MTPDWFSSFPDLYFFSPIKAAEFLWNDKHFDYARSFNMPSRMLRELSIQDGSEDHFIYRGNEYSLRGIYAYDAHTEFYALFKDKLEALLGRVINHPEVIGRYFYLISDDSLGICWYKGRGKMSFRPLRQGFHLNWWRPFPSSVPRVYTFDELQEPFVQGALQRIIWAIPVRYDLIKQMVRYAFFRMRMGKFNE